MDEADISLKRSATETSSVGDKLRHARETKGLSQQDAARALCLSVQIIDALEKEDHDKLPAPVFVQGYLKNYAMLLGIPVVVQKSAAPPPAVTLSSFNTVREYSFVSSLIPIISKLFTFVVLAGIITLGFIWWHEKHSAVEKPLSFNNLSIQQDPYPRLALEPFPPDMKPWLNDFQGKSP